MPVFLKNIRKELRTFGRDTRSYSKYRVSKHTVRGAIGIKSVIHKAVVKGETNNYMVHVQFFNIEFSKEKKKGWESITVDGKLWYYKIPTVRQNPVHIKCSGPDFRFRFEKQLFDKNGLIGTFRRYKRKTPPAVRPKNPKNPNPIGHDFQNPDNYLGFCKHIQSLLLFLKNAGLLKE